MNRFEETFIIDLTEHVHTTCCWPLHGYSGLSNQRITAFISLLGFPYMGGILRVGVGSSLLCDLGCSLTDPQLFFFFFTFLYAGIQACASRHGLCWTILKD